MKVFGWQIPGTAKPAVRPAVPSSSKAQSGVTVITLGADGTVEQIDQIVEDVVNDRFTNQGIPDEQTVGDDFDIGALDPSGNDASATLQTRLSAMLGRAVDVQCDTPELGQCQVKMPLAQSVATFADIEDLAPYGFTGEKLATDFAPKAYEPPLWSVPGNTMTAIVKTIADKLKTPVDTVTAENALALIKKCKPYNTISNLHIELYDDGSFGISGVPSDVSRKTLTGIIHQPKDAITRYFTSVALTIPEATLEDMVAKHAPAIASEAGTQAADTAEDKSDTGLLGASVAEFHATAASASEPVAGTPAEDPDAPIKMDFDDLALSDDLPTQPRAKPTLVGGTDTEDRIPLEEHSDTVVIPTNEAAASAKPTLVAGGVKVSPTSIAPGTAPKPPADVKPQTPWETVVENTLKAKLGISGAASLSKKTETFNFTVEESQVARIQNALAELGFPADQVAGYSKPHATENWLVPNERPNEHNDGTYGVFGRNAVYGALVRAHADAELAYAQAKGEKGKKPAPIPSLETWTNTMPAKGNIAAKLGTSMVGIQPVPKMATKDETSHPGVIISEIPAGTPLTHLFSGEDAEKVTVVKLIKFSIPAHLARSILERSTPGLQKPAAVEKAS